MEEKQDHIQKAHRLFSRIQGHAYELGQLFTDVYLNDEFLWLRRHVRCFDGIIDLGANLQSQIWQYRFALVWEYLPNSREDMLALCRERLTQVIEEQNILIQTPRPHTDRPLRWIAQAGLLLRPADSLSVKKFLRGLAALEQAVMDRLAREADAHMVEAEIHQFYLSLYNCALAGHIDVQEEKPPRLRITDQHSHTFQTDEQALILVADNLQRIDALPAAERANVSITAYYDATPEDPMVTAGVVQLSNGKTYRCERWQNEEHWRATQQLF